MKRGLALALMAVLLAAGCGGASRETPPPRTGATGPAYLTARGPGMRRGALDRLSYPFPRSFDLAHVTTGTFTAALGRDPQKIFEFMRDEVAYQAYQGILRGPGGTLLARSGNAADRALLLAALLREAGQRVRFVRGKLPDRDARDLVASMWGTGSLPAAPDGSPPGVDQLGRIVDGVMPNVQRNFTLIRDLTQRVHSSSLDAGPTLESLLEEARDHVWVQWDRSGQWVDLDPSFADAAPGRTFARGEEILNELPDSLYHHLIIRVQVEEQTGQSASTRDVLSHTARAADLSGADVVLAHMPEHWQGPVDDLGKALSSAATSTGRIRPVLLLGTDVIVGEPFRQRPPRGVAGVGRMLRGEGTRRAEALVTAERLHVELRAPGGRVETLTRELVDAIGKAARRAGRTLAAEEVARAADNAPDITQSVYSLFFSTGAVDRAHLDNIPLAPGSASDDPGDLLMALRRLSLLFTALSDGLLSLVRNERAAILFYPDAPRLTIAEFSYDGQAWRFALDLRGGHVRTAATGAHPQEVFRARVLRGVVDGALEHALLSYVVADLRGADARWGSPLSTIALFERIPEAGAATILLPQDASRLDASIPADAVARLSEEQANGFVLITPDRPILLDGRPRLAWWRIKPGSGETIAVTDEGLHQVVVEYQVQRDKTTNNSRIVYREVVNGVARPWARSEWMNPASRQWGTLYNDFARVMQGARRLPTIWR